MEDDLEEFDINACCSDDFVSDGPKGCKSDPGSLILNLERSTNAHEYAASDFSEQIPFVESLRDCNYDPDHAVRRSWTSLQHKTQQGQ